MAGFPPDFSNSGFRYYSKPFDTNKGVQSFTVLYDEDLVWYNGVTLTTGGWRPAKPSDFAANINVSGLDLSVGAVSITGNPQIQISNTPGVTVQNPIAVTGGAITVSSLPNVTVGNAVVPVSGNIRVLGGGALNVAVTGGVLSTSSSATAVTGNVSVIVGNPIAVTGLTVNTTVNTVAVTGNPQVTISNPIAVTGLTVNTTVNTVAITGSPNVTVVGTVTAIDPDSRALLSGISGSLASNLSDPAWVTGQISITNPIAVTGLTVNTTVNTVAVTGSPSVTIANPIAVTGLTVNTTVNTVAVTGTVTVHPTTATSANNSIPSGSPAPWTSMSSYNTGQVLASNQNRITCFVQNIHSGIPLYVSLSSTSANTGNFHFILNPSTQQGWGGTSWASDTYRGPICVSGGAWIAWEM